VSTASTRLLQPQGRLVPQTLDLGPENQMILSLAGAKQASRRMLRVTPRHRLSTGPRIGGVVLATRHAGHWKREKSSRSPRSLAHPSAPRSLAPFGLVPAADHGFRLSPTTAFLYVACWGTGETAAVRRGHNHCGRRLNRHRQARRHRATPSRIPRSSIFRGRPILGWRSATTACGST